MIFLRKYATLTVTGTTAIRIPITKRGVVDWAVGADWTPAAGDVKVSIDGASPANVTNLPTAVASGNTAYWEFIPTAAEVTCKQAIYTISDAATKAIEDDGFIIETFGHASAMYPADMSASALPANITQAMGTALTEGASGRMAAALSAFLNVASPVFTVASVNQTGDNYSRLGAPAGASIEADIAAIFARLGAPAGASHAADIAAVNAKTTNLPGSPAAVGSAMTLTSGERDSIAAALLDLANGIETGLTLRQSQRLISAILAGVLSGAATTTITIKGAGVATTRVVATVDSDGNRSALTLTP